MFLLRRGSGYLVCGAVGLLLGAALSHLAASRRGAGQEDRERAYRDRIAALESALAHAPARRPGDAEVGPGPAASERAVEASGHPGAPGPKLEAQRQQESEPRLNPEEIRALIRKGDRASSVRAALSIAHLDHLQTELALVRELFAFGHPAARYAALVVGDSGRWPADAADLWCVILREEQESEFLSRAARELARKGNPAAIPALEEVFRRGELEVQKEAAIALESLGHIGAREEMIARLVPKLGDPDGSLRRKAVVMMGELGTAGVLPPLGQALADADSEVRWRAVQSLQQTRLKRAIPYLERAFADSNRNIAAGAKAAIEDLKESGRPE